MEEQQDNPQPKANTNLKPFQGPDGRFLPGSCPNPGGGSASKGYARWEERVAILEERYDTCEKLMQFFVLDKAGRLQPTVELRQMNPRDARIIRQLAATITGNNMFNENEAFWNRMQGKPTQVQVLQGPDGRPLFDPTKGPLPAASEEEALLAAQQVLRQKPQ